MPSVAPRLEFVQEKSSFRFNGVAALSDLGTEGWRLLWEHLEAHQVNFLRLEALFRSPEYKWPRDPLHTWSRVWEYPYVLEQLAHWVGASPGGTRQVVDLGSGVTFFPFVVASLGLDVVCTDIDPVCERDMNRAIATLSQQEGRVSFRMGDGGRLPFDDREVDALYCISVLEHVEEPIGLIAEIGRVLRTGGLLILTMDLDLRGDAALGVGERSDLLAALHRSFRPMCAERSVHPADILRSDSGPYPVRVPALSRPRTLARAIRGRAQPTAPFHLAVEGLVFCRR